MYAVEYKNVTKKYKNKTALDGLQLCVEAGGLCTILGSNGAGKTTAVKIACCLLEPDQGEAYIFGKSCKTDEKDVKRLVGICPQETAAAPNLTVYENLQILCEIFGYKDSKERAEELIKRFGLKEYEKTQAKALSGGWKRMLSFAMAIASEPKVLFLDEPTVGLDIISRRHIWKTIEELKEKMTVILTTHYMEEAEALSDKIAFLSGGKCTAYGTLSEIYEMTGKNRLEDVFIALSGEAGI